MNLPAEWLATLSKIQAVFPGAVIAGGALRDLDNGRQIKDVDIFIPVPHGLTDADVTKVWELFPGAELDSSTTYGIKTVNEDADRDIYAIFKLSGQYSLFDGGETREYKYDLIFCTLAATNVHTFDINLCQIVHTGTELFRTDAYLEAVHTKTLRIMNVNRTDRNAARMERIRSKYPDFTVIQ